MTGLNIPQPDITLRLDKDGVIQDASLSDALSDEQIESWIGRPWSETVSDVGEDKVRRMVADARERSVSGFRQVTQRFPSGLELLIEFTTVSLGGKAGFIAIGKSLQAVAELQSRLIAAQQALERDYWKLREVETRYRLLFDTSNDAVVLLKAATLRIVEANPAALRALGLGAIRPDRVSGREFLSTVDSGEHVALAGMFERAREFGKSSGIIVHLGPAREAWMVRASTMNSETGLLFLLQFSPLKTPKLSESVSVEQLMDRAPDPFLVVDRAGVVLRVNNAFLDLAQVGTHQAVIGEHLGRWLGRVGADFGVLLATVQQHGVVRLFTTVLRGELGAETEVEVSAVGNTESEPHYVGMIVRDIGRRLARLEGERLDAVLGALSHRLGQASLRALVRENIEVFERHCISAALQLTEGNRTAAAELLGLSRQSLYAKLNQYGLSGDGAREASAGTPDQPN